jgi:hypothetical protein
VTAADAPNRFEDSSRPLAGNNETQQLTRAILETLKTDMLPLTQAILETLKTIRALLEKLQAQDPGLAPLSIIVRGPSAGGDLPAEISMSSSRRSDRDEVIDRILDLFEEKLRSRNAQRREPKTSDNKGGRHPYDEDVEWWFLLAEDLADHDRISVEARFYRLKELCDSHGVDAPGLTTFKNRRSELRQRLGRKGRLKRFLTNV